MRSPIAVKTPICNEAGERHVHKSKRFSLLNVFVPGPQSRGKSMGTGHLFDRRCQSGRFACRCTLHSCTAIPFFTLFLDVEYTGELIYEPTTESREFVLSFCHLCCISDLFSAQGCREVSRPKLCLWTKYYRINRQLVCGQRDTVHQSFTEAKGEFLSSSLVGQWRAPYWYLCRWVCR